MFDYTHLQNVNATTLDTGRTYHTPAGDFPSITTILGKTAYMPWMQRWKDKLIRELGSEVEAIAEMKRISKEATDRGEKVHKYAEDHFNGIDIFPELINDYEFVDIQNMTRNLITATEEGVTNIWGQEMALYHEDRGYAGRVDMVGEWYDEPAIIDFKTSKKKKSVSQIGDYYIQCAAYAAAHNKLFGTKINKLVIIITVEGQDKAQVFEGKTIHYMGDLKNRIATYYRMYGTNS